MNPNKIRTRKELVEFIESLSSEIGSQEWTNLDLKSYFEAMAAWIEDMDGYYENKGQMVPEQPTWEIFADILKAATMYE